MSAFYHDAEIFCRLSVKITDKTAWDDAKQAASRTALRRTKCCAKRRFGSRNGRQ
jgi:hypothetical protein